MKVVAMKVVKKVRNPNGRLLHDVEDIDGVKVLTERVKKRSEEYSKAKARPRITAGRSHLATQSWKETEGEDIYLRRAKLFARICEQVPIAIFDDELIVGSQTQYVRGCSPPLDWSTDAGDEVLAGNKDVGRSEALKCDISDEDFLAIKEDVAFWHGKSPDVIIKKVTEQQLGMSVDELIAPGITLSPFGHATPIWHHDADYERILRIGLKGILKEVKERREALKFENGDDGEKCVFYLAAEITLKAMITYAKRYAELARKLSGQTSDPRRKRELERIAETCDWVPENPARNFYEAVQSCRFIHLGLNLETGGGAEQVSRLDQYLFPYYEKDIKEGIITLQEATEIMACIWMKINEMDIMRPGNRKMTGAGSYGTHVTIGGVDRDGNDATNELTYLSLKIGKELKTPISIYLRVHENTPDELMKRAIETNRAVGGGIPSFLNDERVIPNLVQDGVTLEDARDWVGFGCVHPHIAHGSGQYNNFPVFNAPKCLELVMYNGFDPRTGKQIGLQTGDPRSFKSIEDWIDAWQKQFEYWFTFLNQIGNIGWHIRSQIYAIPFHSALVNDCLAKGKDVFRGGLRYPQLLLGSLCMLRANTADSLMAIKRLVYDEKKLTVDELLDACAHNFEGGGRGQIQQMLLAAPKYGNDEDEPDEMMKRLSMWMSHFVPSVNGPYGYPKRDCRQGAAAHYTAGRLVGALPDGRKAWEPLADGGISPFRGADKQGPTAVLRSAFKIINTNENRSAVLNQKISPALLGTEENVMKLIALIRTFFNDYHGYMIQFNILSREQLLEAKVHPEEYRDLVVRVGGFAAYFVELPPMLQDEVITRTEQQF